MAILKSEDEDYVTSFTLSPDSKVISPKDSSLTNQAIQFFDWQIRSGNRVIKPIDRVSNSEQKFVEDGYVLFRDPLDEVKQLIDRLSSVLAKKKNTIIFEPSEPSIDLSITRQNSPGLKVQIFIDEANVQSGISRFDAIGVRFFTTEEMLALFINDLKREFNC